MPCKLSVFDRLVRLGLGLAFAMALLEPGLHHLVHPAWWLLPGTLLGAGRRSPSATSSTSPTTSSALGSAVRLPQRHTRARGWVRARRAARTRPLRTARYPAWAATSRRAAPAQRQVERGGQHQQPHAGLSIVGQDGGGGRG